MNAGWNWLCLLSGSFCSSPPLWSLVTWVGVGFVWGQRCCTDTVYFWETPPSCGVLALLWTLPWTMSMDMDDLGEILNSFIFSPPSHVRAGYFTKLTVSPSLWLNLVRDNHIQPNQPLNHQATQLKPLNCLALQAQAVLICFYELPWKYVLWPLQIMQMQMTCAFDWFLAKIFYCSKVAQVLREERFAFITICLDWHVCPTLPIKSSSNAVYLSALLAP